MDAHRLQPHRLHIGPDALWERARTIARQGRSALSTPATQLLRYAKKDRPGSSDFRQVCPLLRIGVAESRPTGLPRAGPPAVIASWNWGSTRCPTVTSPPRRAPQKQTGTGERDESWSRRRYGLVTTERGPTSGSRSPGSRSGRAIAPSERSAGSCASWSLQTRRRSGRWGPALQGTGSRVVAWRAGLVSLAGGEPGHGNSNR